MGGQTASASALPAPGSLSAAVAELCDEALRRAVDPTLRSALVEIRVKLSEPLRVAVAGSVSSGKSTLINALLGRDIAPVDAGDCTKVVTSFRYGFPESVETRGDGGGRATIPLRSGQTLDEVVLDLTGVASLVVRISSDRLRSLTLVDTPGLDSIAPERETGTAAEIGFDGVSLESASRTAIVRSDALIVLMSQARRFSADLLERFRDLYAGSGLSAANAVAVLSKIDRLTPPGSDPWPVARRLAANAASELASAVADVIPVAGLAAAASRTGRLTELDAWALRTLNAMGGDALDDALLSPRDFLTADIEIDDATRRRLLERLDLFGIRVGTAAASEGGASAVLRALYEVSGYSALDDVLTASFAQRADVLKASVCACDLERLSYLAGTQEDEKLLRSLRDPLDQLGYDSRFQELRLLDVIRQVTDGQLDLPTDLALDIERVARGAAPATRLGLPADADRPRLAAAAAQAAARWARWANDPRRTAHQRAAARHVKVGYEWIWHSLSQDEQLPGAEHGA